MDDATEPEVVVVLPEEAVRAAKLSAPDCIMDVPGGVQLAPT
jgi:hypothetical protein